ncbi:zinc ribbon domain-containing protein [Propionibacteriaceae bacterium G1746]
MQASPTDQRRLLELAEVDLAITRAKHRRSTLPELAQLGDLAGQRKAVTQTLVAAETALSDLVVEQDRLEADLTPARARLERNQKKVDDGEIADPKALRAMVEEIEHLKGRITKLEDEELELMQQIEDATGVRDDIAGKRRVIDEQGRAMLGRRDAAFGEIDAEVTELSARREGVARVLAADLVGLYEKAAAKAGTGAAKFADGRCQGCRVEADAADLRRYSSAGPDDVVRCEECGRILVRA